jgi:hypothetical protein
LPNNLAAAPNERPPAKRVGFFIPESGLFADFEEILENDVTFLPVLRLYK